MVTVVAVTFSSAGMLWFRCSQVRRGMYAMCLRRRALLATCPRRSVGAVRCALLATFGAVPQAEPRKC